MVEKKFAKNSTAPLNIRFDLTESVDEMFEKIRFWVKWANENPVKLIFPK